MRALELLSRFIPAYACAAEGMDPSAFDFPAGNGVEETSSSIDKMLEVFEKATGQSFPNDPLEQLNQVARAMAQAWNAPSARILRRARGAPERGGLGLVVQEMAIGLGSGLCGTGHYQGIDDKTGAPEPSLTFQDLPRAGRPDDAASAPLNETAPGTLAELEEVARTAAAGLGDVFQFDFALTDGKLAILDASPARRNARASVRIAVDLAETGAISRRTALRRINPRNLVEHLHPQINPEANRDVFGIGLAASPGAATGRIVFTSRDALAAAAKGETAILVRLETSPESPSEIISFFGKAFGASIELTPIAGTPMRFGSSTPNPWPGGGSD